MRLIKTKSYKMIEYHGNHIPQYAILSHTWGAGEITYQNMQKLSPKIRNSKRGWSKIQEACRVAQEHDLDFLWVDTCCIDKTNSVELSEAINSMFQWYRRSEMCIVHLADVSVIHDKPQDVIFKARWWQRGWTLQELIAPSELRFFTSTWQELGSKMEWAKAISQQIGIPIGALQGDLSPTVASAAQKFSWAAERQTTRQEDEAYCLLGLFDVNMPLLYGEGPRAFRRLQEEIIKQSNDLTTFAHNATKLTGDLFAQGPADFQHSGNVRTRIAVNRVEFSITNRGLRITGEVPIHAGYRSRNGVGDEAMYFIHLGDDRSSNNIVLYLTKIGARVYHREYSSKGLGSLKHPENGLGMSQSSDCYILPYGDRGDMEAHSDTTAGAISLPSIPIQNAIEFGPRLGMLPIDFAPYASYNHVQRMFLRRKVVHPARDAWRDVVVAIKGSVQPDTVASLSNSLTEVIVLCDYSQAKPKALVFESAKHQRLEAFLFADMNKENSVVWQFLNIMYPEVHTLSDSLVFRGRHDEYQFKVFFRKERFEDLRHDHFHRLRVSIERLSQRAVMTNT